MRIVWLAWLALSQLAGGDTLAMARARDRLLQRLFQSGLRPELDLPGFLRFAGQPSNRRFQVVRQWMTNLVALVQHWIKERCADPLDEAHAKLTPAYVDLIFAFGLARLGETDAANALRKRAQTVLSGLDEAHQFLLRSFEYRIQRSIEGKSQTGPLPPELSATLEGMDKFAAFKVNRLRGDSRILEPDQRINPYAQYFRSSMSDQELALTKLAELQDKTAIVEEVHRLLEGVPQGSEGAEMRQPILRAALALSPRVGEDYARQMLGEATLAFDDAPVQVDPAKIGERAAFLEEALGVAAHFDIVEQIGPLVERFKILLRSQKGEEGVRGLESLADQCLRGLRKLGLREQIDALLTQLCEVVLGTDNLQNLDLEEIPRTPEALRTLLHVAGCWYYFGRFREAEGILQVLRGTLYKDQRLAERPRELASIVCAYAKALGQAPGAVAQKRLDELFEKLPGIRGRASTSSHYNLLQLGVVEAVVLAIVHEDLLLGSSARRWLDEDEYLVRQRIHRDFRRIVATG